MSSTIAITTLADAAPVAMQRGRHRDRIALARLRVKRRWLLRRRHKATLASTTPPAEVRITPESPGPGMNS